MAQKISIAKIKSIINQIKKEVSKDYPISQIFVFGSYAKKKATPKSDLDICLVSPKFKDRFSASVYLNKKLYQLGLLKDFSIDIVGYPQKDFDIQNPLVWEIKHNAIIF